MNTSLTGTSHHLFEGGKIKSLSLAFGQRFLINSFSNGDFKRRSRRRKKNKNKNPEIVDAINLNFQLSYVQVTYTVDIAVSMETFVI